jgi:tRNA-2-methylthio-N6-dimethylallyladenosine synthase
VTAHTLWAPMPLDVYLETFGCQMNELDSELVSSQLRTLGYRFTPDIHAARVVLFNTCSVREHAEQKVWSRLGELAVRKVREPSLVVGVLGCMAEREGDAFIKRMPVIDILVGPADLDKLPSLLDNAVRTRIALAAEAPEPPPPEVDSLPSFIKKSLISAGEIALQGSTSRRSQTLAAAADQLELLDLARATSPDDHSGSAYVRITRGCNKFCTYCVVPFTRGAEVHRPPDHIVDECKRLADAGIIEITLLGQTVNHYRFEDSAAVTVNSVTQPQKGRVYKSGEDFSDAYTGERVTTFAGLLKRIHDEVPAIQRLRFVTSYPKSFGNDVLQVIRESPRICRYLHVPAQSGSDRMLKAMNRGYSVQEYLDFLDRAREFLHQPEIGRPLTIAGDIIVGFPGETEDDHLATADLLRKARYKNCFIFKYSPRPGTVAFDKLTDDVPDDVKRRRNNELLKLQQEISSSVGDEFVGQTLDVFVQGVSKRESRRRANTVAHPAHAHDHNHTASGSKGSGVSLSIEGRVHARPAANGPALTAMYAGDKDATAGSVDASCGIVATSVNDLRDAQGSAAEPTQLSGRTEGDLIVLFDAPRGTRPESLIGRMAKVRIASSHTLSLFGEVIATIA